MGAYIRVLGDDIAKTLGTLGHLVSLRRERIGAFDVKDAAAFEDFEHGMNGAVNLIPIEKVLSFIPRVDIPVSESGRFQNGNPFDHAAAPEKCLVFCNGQFLGIGAAREGRVWPKRVFTPS